ncbi:TonB-dependent receptor [Parvularcula bermudensis HTCC2503]|uniref:TonB-dependent receptor n=1 Tax=Parvularcula bermudensis (strain ATCC BAA-594 / HTCC2503 / KCTC 12087) TaxID=314260 RepID=E0TDK5_PARBH|nr:TonB-dependent receptor [Parvularcula bermudensis]ADM08760.1 TonB-dependent receptor [Parvularcula bermudensis HTCC2503]
MRSKLHARLLSGAAVLALGAPAFAQDAEPALQDVIIVTGTRIDPATETGITPDAAPLQGGDITYLTARTPGGARLGNGELSGQMQYRGLFGERLNLRVDGQRFASGGPNLMDPVFHYAPAPLVAAIVIDRGVSPVSAGPGLAGGADAVFKRVDYAQGDEARFGYDLTVGARSVNDSLSTGGVVGLASDAWRVNLLGAWEKGDDTEFGDGEIGGTAFERGVYGLSAGARTALGEFTLDLRRQNTGPSGTPPFPMDIQYFDTDFARLGYAKAFGDLHFTASVHATDIVHLMDNFSLRPAPMPGRQRATFADASTQGGEGSISFPAFGGDLALGLDGEQVEHDVTITNPTNTDFFVTPFPRVEMQRFGGFAEWSGALGAINAQLGLRADRNGYDAGEASLGSALPMGPRMLATAFNDADRSGEDTTVDAVARLWTTERGGLSWRVTLAHKQQVPGYIQRFGWLPINASGGLADGNIYVGDLALEPETAWIAEAGYDYASARAYLRPTVFIRQIDDYIQGVPFDGTVGVADSPVEMIATMNGDPTPLRWANVEARLYGLDMDGGYDFDGPLRLDGVFSYVRGERRDIDDNLYRVAPLNLTLGLTWEADVWSATVETRAVADQEEVSLTNSEEATDGYVVLSAYGEWDLYDGVTLSAGVENLLDEVYQDHLAGYNRNGFGDVPVGDRLPGAGRGMFVRLNMSY